MLSCNQRGAGAAIANIKSTTTAAVNFSDNDIPSEEEEEQVVCISSRRM